MPRQLLTIWTDFQYKVPRIYFKIPRVLPYKDQKEKFETDDFFKKLQREGEVRVSDRDRIFMRNGRAMAKLTVVSLI